MALSTRRATGLTAAIATVASLLLAGSAFGADQRLVKLQDDCEPVSFAAAGVPCVGDGRTTIQALIFTAQTVGAVDRWQFSRPEFNIDAGGTITAVNAGGEGHTFTRVDAFGDGCLPVLNPGGLPGKPAVDDCATFNPATDPRVLAPGQAMTVTVAGPGPVLFQCLIHPWMRAVVDVRGRGNRGES
jgi:plastocyanin